MAIRILAVPSLALQVGLCTSLSSDSEVSRAFASFVQQYGREYEEGSEEYEHRRSVFEQSVREIELHNSRPRRLWTAGINFLSDRNEEELKRLRGWQGVAGQRAGVRGAAVSRHNSGGMSLRQTSRAKSLPEEISWSHLNALSKARNQGSCGSCWAIASVSILDANHEIHQRTGRTFSAQELVNCVANPWHCGGGGGCQGATVEQALDYALKHGLGDATETPYLGQDAACSKDLTMVGDSSTSQPEMFLAGLHAAKESSVGLSSFGLRGWERLPQNQYEPLMRSVVEHGPVGVSVAASAWSHYTSGIFDGCDADAVINHAVTLIGYGKDDGLQQMFWTVQNSWSSDWGEGGRIRILRRDSDETECGTDHQPDQGTGCDGGPTEVTVCGMCGILYDSVVPHFADGEE